LQPIYLSFLSFLSTPHFPHAPLLTRRSIEAAELEALLRALRVPVKEEEILLLVRAMDRDNSGDIDYEEFAKW